MTSVGESFTETPSGVAAHRRRRKPVDAMRRSEQRAQERAHRRAAKTVRKRSKGALPHCLTRRTRERARTPVRVALPAPSPLLPPLLDPVNDLHDSSRRSNDRHASTRTRPGRGLTSRKRSVSAGHDVVTRSLPSWLCGFDPRHPLSFADVRTRPWLSGRQRAPGWPPAFRLALPFAPEPLFRVFHGTSMARPSCRDSGGSAGLAGAPSRRRACRRYHPSRRLRPRRLLAAHRPTVRTFTPPAGGAAGASGSRESRLAWTLTTVGRMASDSAAWFDERRIFGVVGAVAAAVVGVMSLLELDDVDARDVVVIAAAVGSYLVYAVVPRCPAWAPFAVACVAVTALNTAGPADRGRDVLRRARARAPRAERTAPRDRARVRARRGRAAGDLGRVRRERLSAGSTG